MDLKKGDHNLKKKQKQKKKSVAHEGIEPQSVAWKSSA
jgi:hypothetical protein